ncbi:methyl-accepting chemotaxis protein [Ornithinibacillus bavariensis]|uniref:methyl-accepting chemotaxis protein n=1 Tax=Ornithinibacillus bavariensis TaxID=545502 RepID=UPI000EE3F6EE|nr:methyl-accepting chemotaxis protein [Ornithinibacillus sp.]
MKNLFNFKSVRTKVLFGFLAVIVLVLLLALFILTNINKAVENTKEMINKQVPLLIADEEISFNMVNRAGLVRSYFLYDDYHARDLFEEQIEESINLENIIMELSDSKDIKALIDKKVEWGTLINEAFSEYDSGNKEAALRIMQDQVNPLESEIINGFKDSAKLREELIIEQGQEVIKNGTLSTVTSFIVSILVIILGVIIAIITSKTITTPIKKVMIKMKQMASGDLYQDALVTSTRDEIGQLVVATNEMHENMRAMLNQINVVSDMVSGQSIELTQSANEVREGAEQIASTMDELASGTENQANSAGDLSAVMNSFSVRVQEANEKSKHIEKDSKEILQLTDEGSSLMKSSTKQMYKIDQIVHDAVKKVEGLDTHTQNISNLVSVIKAIADQTNLLALNAAIEAARAGEHGKGFAVVADEVRKLAEQVSLSVSDITQIVTNIQVESTIVTESLQEGYKEVQVGTVNIGATDETFTKINQAISSMAKGISTITNNLTTIAANSQEMNGSIQEIAAISEEAAAGVEQTTASAQQVRSSMEEVAVSSEQLAEQSEELNQLIRKFRL